MSLVPPVVQRGDTLGVAAPSGAFEAERLQPGVAYLQQRGYDVRVGAAVYNRERYLAGLDVDRAADLNGLFADSRVRAIFAARGGYGSARLLDLLDYDIIVDTPPALVGFSDTTALQLGLYARVGLVSYSGVTLCGDVTDNGFHSDTEASLWQALEENQFAPIPGLETLKGDAAEGPFLGGCLSLVVSLLGTPFFPNPQGALWFLEDVNEAPYRVDRMLSHLRMAGVFERASGVVFGQFWQCEPDREEEGTVADVLEAFVASVPCPVFRGLPYGHGPGRRVLPVGLNARVAGGVLSFGV